MNTLEDHFENETRIIFEKYTIDVSGVIRNKRTRKIASIFN